MSESDFFHPFIQYTCLLLKNFLTVKGAKKKEEILHEANQT